MDGDPPTSCSGTRSCAEARSSSGSSRPGSTDSLVKEEGLSQGEATGDYRNLVMALQVTNRSDYLGYRFNTQFGYMMNWRNAERYQREPLAETGGLSFLTIYAALR